MATLSDERLEMARGLLERYPVPWRAVVDDIDCRIMATTVNPLGRYVVYEEWQGGPPTLEERDAAIKDFAALALYPDLLAEVDRLRARVAELEDANTRMRQRLESLL